MNILPIHQNIYNKLDYFIQSNNIPHIIFHGKTGSGKRTIVNNFLNKIYHNDKQNIKSNVLHVNCAHGKGIKFIREELKFFAKSNIQTKQHVPFKSIVLLNAGYLTMDAQSALRRCIELFSYNTRFFIIIENKNKLLNPILSRFCEIYVPEFMNADQEILNLHSFFIDKSYDIDQTKENIKIIDDKCKNVEKIHESFMSIAEDLYQNGMSCLDLIEYVNQNEDINETDKITVSLCFDKIRSEFRNEKLLMLFILDFIYIRSNKDLKCISVL
tara:strand:+ start:3604 stop:4416 length:813 start_codon:yes stop_codon:yes gene_type:complete